METMGLFVYYLSWKTQSMWLPRLTKGRYIWMDMCGDIDSVKAYLGGNSEK